MFKSIGDKDVFQLFCARELMRHLLYRISASDEAETSMISKLKVVCGFEVAE